MDSDLLERVTGRIRDRLASGEALPPSAVRFLVHRFARTGAEDLRAGLGVALADVVSGEADGAGGAGVAEPPLATDAETAAARALLLAESFEVADDPALADALDRAVRRCRAAWPLRGSTAAAGRNLEACLTAGAARASTEVVAAAVDELERVVGVVYEPGDGVAQVVTTRTRTAGDLDTHASMALALLRAFDVTGRVAYAMLADELARAMPAFPAEASTASFDAARVAARLAVLQRDDAYRAAAVTREDSVHARDADARLRGFEPPPDAPAALSAAYGFALEERLGLT